MEKTTQHPQGLIITDLKKKYPALTDNDFISLAAHGLAPETVANQLRIFREGIAKTQLDRPAVKGDGILVVADEQHAAYAELFDRKKAGYKLKKFVPASGAASRMFKFLIEFWNEFELGKETVNAYINRKEAKELQVFLAGMEKFPFYAAVMTKLNRQFPDFATFSIDQKTYYFIEVMLSEEGFDFCNKAKGVLAFHKYADHITTPVEEHLNEGAFYAASNNESHIHFTVSEAHRGDFESIISAVRPKVEARSGNRIHINYSHQNKATDSISVDAQNHPIHIDGELAFRPGGHGALMDNLSHLDADIIFIKNIDNVIQNHIDQITLYKKSLAGLLLQLKEKVFESLRQLESGSIDENQMAAMAQFASSQLNIDIDEDFGKYTAENKIAYLKDKLNRPLRVCGMVKNEGEVGGGPFWVRNKKGHVALQIVEGNQVDHDNKSQVAILKSATHFNPVDLVCYIRDHNGNKFDLQQFTDPESGFIVEKIKKGKIVRSYELPGLWNGAMARWITVFVEVPLLTFNPVKTVNDLLKSAHQPQ